MNTGPAPVLLTSAQRTSTTVLLAEAAARRGLEVATLDGPLLIETWAGRQVHWYGGPLAADRIGGGLDLALLEPADDWLAGLPEEFTGRRIELTTLSEAWTARRSLFAKPPSDKQFPAEVYADGSRLPRAGERTAAGTVVGGSAQRRRCRPGAVDSGPPLGDDQRGDGAEQRHAEHDGQDYGEVHATAFIGTWSGTWEKSPARYGPGRRTAHPTPSRPPRPPGVARPAGSTGAALALSQCPTIRRSQRERASRASRLRTARGARVSKPWNAPGHTCSSAWPPACQIPLA